MNFRIKVIQNLIELNEAIFFYPKLKKFYNQHIKDAKPVLLDVGSNKGQYIDFFLSINKNTSIFGFEPNPTLNKILLAKYHNNSAIKILNIGISDKNGKLTFHENVMDETSSFEELNYDSNYLSMKAKVLGVALENLINKKYDVAVRKLSDIIIDENIKHIDLLKIDTEGHEYNCFLGLFDNGFKPPIRYIQIESHQDDMYKNKSKDSLIPKLLNDNGFIEINRIKHGFGDFYEIIYRNTNYN